MIDKEFMALFHRLQEMVAKHGAEIIALQSHSRGLRLEVESLKTKVSQLVLKPDRIRDLECSEENLEMEVRAYRGLAEATMRENIELSDRLAKLKGGS